MRLSVKHDYIALNHTDSEAIMIVILRGHNYAMF